MENQQNMENQQKSTDSNYQPLLEDSQSPQGSQQASSHASINGGTQGETYTATEQPCEKNMEKALIWTVGLFTGQSIAHIMDMVHRHETPNAADPIAFGGYSLMLTLGILLLKAKSASCSDTLPESVIPVLRFIALAGFSYALIQVGIDDWDDISSSPDIPTNTTNSSFGL